MVRARVQRCTSSELKRLLLEPTGGRYYPPSNPYDEVYPGVLLGDADTALSTTVLKDLGVTHVLNAAQGHNSDVYGGYVNTNISYYRHHRIAFLGIPAMDMPAFYMKPYFQEAAEFINNALKMNGKVLVHCQCGISRSAALVLAFMILKRGMTVQTALATVSARRNIFPNQGFMEQLCDLDYEQRTSLRLQEASIPSSIPRRSSSPSPGRDYCRRPETPTTSTYTSSPYLSTSYSNSNSSLNTYPKYFSSRFMGKNTTPFESPYVPRRAQSVDRFVPTQTYSRYDSPLSGLSASMDALPSSPYHYRSTLPRSASPSPVPTSSYRASSVPSAYFNRYSASASRYHNESSDSEDECDPRDKLPLNSVHSSYRPHNYIAGSARASSDANKCGYRSSLSAKANYCSRAPFDSYDKSATTKDLYNRYRFKPNCSVEDNPTTSKLGYSSYNGSPSYPTSLFANGIPTYNQYLTRTSPAMTPEALSYHNSYSMPMVPRVHA